MNTKHTPGPWRVYNYAGALGCRGIRAPSSKRDLATTAGLYNDDEDIANAALIAAAPELLEALKSAVMQLRALNGIKADGWTHPAGLIAELEYTIAKSEGALP